MQSDSEGGVGLYAHDTVLFVSGQSSTELETRMNDNLRKLSEWAASSRLSINAKNTKYVHFRASRRLQNCPFSLCIDGVPLTSTGEYEYLGLLLKGRLTFERHVNKVFSSCNQCLFTFSKIRKYLDKKTAIRIYKSLIMSKLNYGSIFYGDAKRQLVDHLQKMQNKALMPSDFQVYLEPKAT